MVVPVTGLGVAAAGVATVGGWFTYVTLKFLANSDVFPDESVAVAEMTAPAGTGRADKRRIKARIAESVGRDVRGTDVGLAFSVARRISDGAPVEIDLVVARYSGVQCSGHGQARAVGDGVGKDGIVLQVVWPDAGWQVRSA